jgi:hypothetical protein
VLLRQADIQSLSQSATNHILSLLATTIKSDGRASGNALALCSYVMATAGDTLRRSEAVAHVLQASIDGVVRAAAGACDDDAREFNNSRDDMAGTGFDTGKGHDHDVNSDQELCGRLNGVEGGHDASHNDDEQQPCMEDSSSRSHDGTMRDTNGQNGAHVGSCSDETAKPRHNSERDANTATENLHAALECTYMILSECRDRAWGDVLSSLGHAVQRALQVRRSMHARQMALACAEVYASLHNDCNKVHDHSTGAVANSRVPAELVACVVPALADAHDSVRQTALSAVRAFLLLTTEANLWSVDLLESVKMHVQGMVDEGEGGEEATEVLARIQGLLSA